MTIPQPNSHSNDSERGGNAEIIGHSIHEVNEKLAASSLRMAMVPISQCDLLEKNARFMRVEQCRRLVDSIRRDGCLTSVPFAVRRADWTR